MAEPAADQPQPTVDRDTTTLADRFRAAGIPVPPPMSEEQRYDWDCRQAEADAQPRVYGPRTAA